MARCYKTFISVGNAKQHFLRLLNPLESLVDILPQPVLIQCGYSPYQSKLYDVIDFIPMDTFTDYIHNAQLLILHAGAGSVLQAIKANKRPIIVPRKMQFNEHVNDHQVAFANTLQTEGKVLMVEEVNELRQAIQKVQHEEYNFDQPSQPRALEIIQNLLLQLTAKI